ncbi:MAG: hypothetical protein GY795_03065, partial [Desulfobacterales bacterium]|nr:hypothetical protein [Desulfobacterales bacterium]
MATVHLVPTLCVTAIKSRGRHFKVPIGTADNSPAIHDTVGKFYSLRADTSDAAERQSDKAWGFEPQVGIVVNFCALKGR